MEVIRIIKDESLIFGKTSLDISSSIDPNDVTSFVPTKVLETKEVNLGGWYVDIEAALSEKSKIEQDYILLVDTKSKGVQPFRVHNKEVKKRRVLARAYHVMFDSELYVVEDYSADKLGTLTVLNGLNNNLDRPSPYTFTVSHAGSTTMDFSGMTLLEAWEHLVDNKAALVEADWYRMYFRNELGRDRGVTISHGKDLEDIVGTEDWSTVVTKIFPYTSGGVTLPEKYLMSEVQYNRPYTRRVEIAVDVDAIREQYPEYSDEQLVPLIQEQLRTNAERHLEESQYPQVTYRVSSNVAEDLDLWDKILVKHPAITYNLPLEGPVDQEAIDRLGIPTKVLAYQYDVISKRTVKLDYGDFYANFSKLFNSKLDKITEEWKRVENNLEQRLDAQTELINNWNKKGHMVLLENEILFLDKLPMGDADNVLKIGLGGIAFSQTGVDGNFTSAWDLEGNFNTDFIGAGQIRTNHLASDVGSSLDLSSNESVNIMVTDKVIEEVDKIELPPGPQGIPGQDGTSLYTWVKYADTPTTGMSDDPTGKKYVGFAYNKTTQTESTNYADYTWSKVEGDQGIPGPPGANGQPTYTWVKYADTPTSGMDDFPDGKKYIGLAFNKTTQTESTSYSQYQWSLMPQNITVGGRNLILGSGTPVESSVYLVAEYFISEDFVEGQEYTVTIKGTKNSAVNFELWQNTASSGRGSLNHVKDDLYQLTFTSVATRAGNERIIRIYQPPSESASKATIEWIKLEKGNIATDWTPAPEDVQNEITRVETETTAKITANTEAINLEYTQRIEEYGTLSDSVSENTRLISANADGIKTLVEDTITDIQGQINTSNERIDSVDSSIQTFSTQITNLEGDMVEQQTFFRTGLDGLTIGGTDWETVMHANGERISFQSQTGSVQAHFGAGGMYVNRWETDFHSIEKFEEGSTKGTIHKNRKGVS